MLANIKKIDEIPFDFSRRRLSVIVSDGTSKKLITKGAIEEILSVCTTVNYKDTINPITSDIKITFYLFLKILTYRE